jgi:hypothetical protein
VESMSGRRANDIHSRLNQDFGNLTVSSYQELVLLKL